MIYRHMQWFGLLGLSIQILLATQSTSDAFKNWPPQWAETYLRFEQFIQAKDSYWPTTNLQVSEKGDFDHTLYIHPNKKSPLTLVITKYGSTGGGWQLSRLFKKSDNLNNRKMRLTPGTYTAQVRSCDTLGYQFYRPLVWFKVKEGPNHRHNPPSYIYEQLKTPPNDGAVLPHPRFTDFLDFHVFTATRNPYLIFENNELMDPAIRLKLHNSGLISRNLLPNPDWEAQLSWRIYKNNQLFEQSSAAGITSKQASESIGSYHAFLVVEGPSGMMPVSNILHFPLFPSKGNHLECYPTDTNGDHTPDCIERIKKHSDLDEPPSSIDDETWTLWNAWQWKIRTKTRLKIEPESENSSSSN